MRFMDNIVKRAKEMVGKGEEPPAPPVDLARTKLDAESKLRTLLKNEEKLQFQLDTYKESAKAALKRGDTRAYDISSAQYKRVAGGLKMASSAVDSARSMIGLMDSQESMKSIVGMSKSVADMQEAMGLDPEEMKDAAFNIRESVSNVEAMSETMQSISEMCTSSDDMAMGDPLKAELLAELQAEAQSVSDEIDEELKELAE